MIVGSKKKCVLHISADYPDANRAETTLAIKRFIKVNHEVDYFIISLNRTANPFKTNCIEGDARGDARVLSLRYFGLPYGILLGFSMWLAALRIYWKIRKRNVHIDVIHAHKLTFEGLTAWWLARWLHVPYILSVRGESESKVLHYKPHYHWLYQKIINASVRICYVSAWYKPILNQYFSIDAAKQVLLPNFIETVNIANKEAFVPNHLITILDLNVYRKKGLDRLLPSFKKILEKYPTSKLDIFGRGKADVITEINLLIDQLDLRGSVELKGALDNQALLIQLPKYAGMLLPSHNETFGMVYVESLLSSVPVLYSLGTGIDGFIDDIPAKIGVDPTNTESITDGILLLLANQDNFREWLSNNKALIQEKFEKDQYIQSYNRLIMELTS
jgi:glycosyltransferase involved in cell wall biosynthesis